MFWQEIKNQIKSWLSLLVHQSLPYIQHGAADTLLVQGVGCVAVGAQAAPAMPYLSSAKGNLGTRC